MDSNLSERTAHQMKNHLQVVVSCLDIIDEAMRVRMGQKDYSEVAEQLFVARKHIQMAMRDLRILAEYVIVFTRRELQSVEGGEKC